jgi:chemotaxis protein methyltransferase CheR
MNDMECVGFLQWALPELRMRWPGFRKVRGQVCKRIGRRLIELGLTDVAAYRSFLENHPEEWVWLDSLCRITISRFWRDRAVWDFLRDALVPELAHRVEERGGTTLCCWSAGCACGEELYTLGLIWSFVVAGQFPGVALRLLGTDADERMLERAREASYVGSSLKDLPRAWRELAFEPRERRFVLRPELREGVELTPQDLRSVLPEGSFDLILCRNLVFTYFEESLQEELLPRILERLTPGGALVIGIHERLPGAPRGLAPWNAALGVYRKIPFSH